jgi:hypothetical protein
MTLIMLNKMHPKNSKIIKYAQNKVMNSLSFSLEKTSAEASKKNIASICHLIQ